MAVASLFSGLQVQVGTKIGAQPFVPTLQPAPPPVDVRQQFKQQVADLAADAQAPPTQTQPQPSYWTDAAPYDFGTPVSQSHQLLVTYQQAAQVQEQAITSTSTTPAFGFTSKPAASGLRRS